MSLRALPSPQRARDYSYTVGVAACALATIFVLPGTLPSTDPIYAPMALALVVGLLLTVRLAPDRVGSALVLLPAMAVDARFGLAALPAIAFAAVLVNLARGRRGPRAISTASHLVLAFAVAHLCAQALPMVPGWIVFAVVFAVGRE